MAVTYEAMTTLIENATMKKVFVNGVHRLYEVTPNEGYVLHDNTYDAPVFDENGDETGEIILGYRTSSATCTVAQLDPENGVNARDFYAVPIDEVPADQIRDVDVPVEVMKDEDNAHVTE